MKKIVALILIAVMSFCTVAFADVVTYSEAVFDAMDVGTNYTYSYFLAEKKADMDYVVIDMENMSIILINSGTILANVYDFTSFVSFDIAVHGVIDISSMSDTYFYIGDYSIGFTLNNIKEYYDALSYWTYFAAQHYIKSHC